MLRDAVGHVAATHGQPLDFPEMPAKWHVEQALRHLTNAADKTTDPGLQGDLHRAIARLQRRIDLTQGL